MTHHKPRCLEWESLINFNACSIVALRMNTGIHIIKGIGVSFKGEFQIILVKYQVTVFSLVEKALK